MYTVLVCDDDRDIVSAVKIYLSSYGYNVISASNGKEAIEKVKQELIHLVIMDIMMPEIDGIAAVAEIRKISKIPIIFLTAKSEDTDKILGLNIGGDDYITKPFNPVELAARVKAQLRRYIDFGGAVISPDELVIGGIVLNDITKTVTSDGEPVQLTPTEFEILRLLMQNPGKVFSTEKIYSAVWKDNPVGSDNIIAVHIRHLREKIEIDPADPRYLKVVWGQGYKIEKSGQS